MDGPRPPDEAQDRGAVRLDPRINAFRPDVADAQLQGVVAADRFVAGRPAQVARALAPLKTKPDLAAQTGSELLYGELVRVFDIAAGWAWVQCEHDHYVGYVSAEALSDELVVATHSVSAAGTFVYAAADIKSPLRMHLSLGSRLAVIGEQDRFAELAGGGFVVRRHLSEQGRTIRDFVGVAEQLVDTPYLWGGRSRIGIDCSGLVQVALAAAGIRAPRDSDMQQAALGEAMTVPADLEGLERGDLVFWPGHVGIMVDGMLLAHANAHHMSVVVEPLATARDRIVQATGHAISTIKRLAT